MSFETKHRMNCSDGTSLSPGWRFTISNYDSASLSNVGSGSHVTTPGLHKQRWVRVTSEREHSSRPAFRDSQQKKTYIQLSQKMMLKPRPASASLCTSRSRLRAHQKNSANYIGHVLDRLKNRPNDAGDDEMRNAELLSDVPYSNINSCSSSANSSRRSPVERERRRDYEFINIFPTGKLKHFFKQNKQISLRHEWIPL